MTTQESINKLNFFVQVYVEIVSMAVKSNDVDGLEAGKLALELLGCPEDVAKDIERRMMIELNEPKEETIKEEGIEVIETEKVDEVEEVETEDDEEAFQRFQDAYGDYDERD